MLFSKFIKIGIWFFIFKTYLAYVPNDNDDCNYSFFAIKDISDSINMNWYQKPQCRSRGIFLTLNNFDTQFSSSLLGLDKNVKITKLKIEGLTPSMKDNMFNVEPFKSVRKLTFDKMRAESLAKGSLNGFESLEILNIHDAIVQNIEIGFLDALNNTLKEFKFIQEGFSEHHAIKVDQFFGSGQLPELKKVTIFYSLEDLTRKSFTGLTNIKYLDLSRCRIKSIGAGTFDPISDSIEYLRLDKNHFTTLPSGLFNSMLSKNIQGISIEGNNNWKCNCELLPLKAITLQYPKKFEGAVRMKCNEPIYFKKQYVHKAEFCEAQLSSTRLTTTVYQSILTQRTKTITDVSTETFTRDLKKVFSQELTEVDSPAFTEPSPQAFTSKTSTENTTSQSNIQSYLNQFSLYCFSSTKPTDSHRSQKIIVKDYKDDFIIVYFDVLHENTTLIWFSYGQGRRYVSTRGSCSIGDRARIVIYDSRKKSENMFCITNGREEPSNCVTHTKHRRSSVLTWLIENNVFVIGVILVTCLPSILILISFIQKTHKRSNYKSMFYKTEKFNSQGYASITSPFNKDLKDTYGTIETT